MGGVFLSILLPGLALTMDDLRIMFVGMRRLALLEEQIDETTFNH